MEAVLLLNVTLGSVNPMVSNLAPPYTLKHFKRRRKSKSHSRHVLLLGLHVSHLSRLGLVPRVPGTIVLRVPCLSIGRGHHNCGERAGTRAQHLLSFCDLVPQIGEEFLLS